MLIQLILTQKPMIVTMQLMSVLVTMTVGFNIVANDAVGRHIAAIVAAGLGLTGEGTNNYHHQCAEKLAMIHPV